MYLTGDYYTTIDQGSVAEFKDKGSRFIGYTIPITDVNDFKEKLASIKKEHPKATHHCFAYRLGLDGTQYRVSDDGEPSGSAGRPILGQIDSKQVTNVLIVVVRYFGGTLLGVPGLINAYKTTAALALQVTTLVQKPVLVNYRLQFDYTQMNEVMKVVKQFDCKVIRQETNLFCSMEIGIPRNWQDEVVFKLQDIRGSELQKIA
ncbi:MAG: YigZ family protein [Chitinophagaceae bacterium]|nr:YigZ family protein [Chitinophagaceae bacterium]